MSAGGCHISQNIKNKLCKLAQVWELDNRPGRGPPYAHRSDRPLELSFLGCSSVLPVQYVFGRDLFQEPVISWMLAFPYYYFGQNSGFSMYFRRLLCRKMLVWLSNDGKVVAGSCCQCYLGWGSSYLSSLLHTLLLSPGNLILPRHS